MKCLYEARAPLLSHCVALGAVLPFSELSFLICSMGRTDSIPLKACWADFLQSCT